MKDDATTQAQAVILMYHRVADLDRDEWDLSISPSTFLEHMTQITRAAHPMSLADLGRSLTRGTVPRGAVAITFDDGCLDNLTTASPILLELGVPATFFIPTERLDEPHEFWWDTLERVFSAQRPHSRPLDLAADLGVVFDQDGDAERTAVLRDLAGRIRGLDWPARDRVMERVIEWAGIDLTPRDTHRPMLPDEIRELGNRPGHEIGAHTVHHLGLPSIVAESRRRELRENKETLEGLLDRQVTAFAYPFGQFDGTADLVAELFSVAVTTRAQAVTSDDRLSTLPRFDANLLSRGDLDHILSSVG